MTRRTHIRWRRVVVWWVVLTCALCGVAVGVVVDASAVTIASAPSLGGISLEEPRAIGDLGDKEALRISPLSSLRTRGAASRLHMFVYTTEYVEWPEPVELTQWLTDEQVRLQAPKHQGPARRLRDVLGRLRDAHGRFRYVVAMDVAAIVPVGMVLQTTHGTGPIVIPREVRRAYPIAIPIASGSSWILIRAWTVVGWSMAIGAIFAVLPAVYVEKVRRVVRRRRGQCVECAYSLVGIAGDAVCPECGETRE